MYMYTCMYTCMCARAHAGGLVYAVLRGGGAGLAGPVLGVTLPHYFGTRRLGRLLGGHAAFLVLGTCAGSLLIGASPQLFGKCQSVSRQASQ